MVRDVSGIRNDMKPNGMTSDRVHVAPSIATDKVEPGQISSTTDRYKREASEEHKENQEVATMKSTNNESGVSNGIRAKIEALKNKLSVDASPSLKPPPDANASESIKISTPRAQSSQEDSKVSESTKISTPKAHSSHEISGGLQSIKVSSPKAHSSQEVSGTPGSLKISTPRAHSSQEVFGTPGSIKISTPRAYSSEEVCDTPKSRKTSTPRAHLSQEDSTDNIASGTSNAPEVEIDNSTNSPISKKNDLHSPVEAKTPQSLSPQMSGKSSQYDTEDKHHDEEESGSFTSSDTSTRSASKFKPTVPVGPKFVCGDRIARRREYYRKLEEKQKAMEAERLAEQARIKEEEEAALKKLRKSMSYKANPVPNFYREGPPPKTKLKKLPLTRPKSPNLTRGRSRDGKKSCESVTTTTPYNKTGSKNRVGGGQETDETNTPPSEAEQIDTSNNVVGETNTSPTT